VFEIKKFEIKNKRKNLPATVFFTDRKKISAANCNLESTIKNLPKHSAIIVREYDLNKQDREIFAQKIISLARPLSLKVLIGKDIILAKKLKSDGVHFSDFDHLPLQALRKKSFPKKFIFSFSCHNLKSLLKASKSQFDMVFISPIFPTTSHLSTKNLGLINLAKISLKTKKPPYCLSSLYALGGVNSSNISSLRKLNLSGLAAINLFLR